ncbi:MAG: biopolymer transporter ExbD [Lentisphaerota bacterium]
MKFRSHSEVEPVHVDLVPMIDTVMFLLIFFMLTTRLGQKETDLGIRLPGMMTQAGPVDMPDEQVIEIDSTGIVSLNGRGFDGKDLPDLVQTLVRYRLASEAASSKYMITIMAADGAEYERVVDVMNACAGAGIKDVTFGTGSG